MTSDQAIYTLDDLQAPPTDPLYLHLEGMAAILKAAYAQGRKDGKQEVFDTITSKLEKL